jgi:uncharacterized protein YodC (DUF2158 family)
VASEQVSVAFPKNPHWECHIAVDQHDSKHILAVSDEYGGRDSGAQVYVTFDGGHQWTPADISKVDAISLNNGDPSIYFLPGGDALFVTYAAIRDGSSAVLVSRSQDGGRTFQAPQKFPPRDRPWLGVDPGSRMFSGRVYLMGNAPAQGWKQESLWSVPAVNKSVDDGRTFESMQLLVQEMFAPGKSQVINGSPEEPVVTSDGVLAIPIESQSLWRLLVSNDGGNTFAPVRDGPPIHYDVPTSGYHFFQNHPMAPSADIDRSGGSYRHRIYVAWVDHEKGQSAVKVARTPDLGFNWALSDVTGDVPTTRAPATPSVAVNPEGIVAVTWLDRRDDPKGLCWRLYGAISIDGGEHFLKEERLSERPTCVSVPGNWRLLSLPSVETWAADGRPAIRVFTEGEVVQLKQGGDTQGLQADSEGVFHAAWINGESGVLQLWHTSFAADTGALKRLHDQQEAQARTEASAVKPDKFATPGRKDVTADVKLEVTTPAIDFEGHVISLTVKVTNTSKTALGAPLDLVLAELTGDGAYGMSFSGMNLKNLHVDGADAGGTGAGATWRLAAPNGDSLAPGESATPRTLHFAFEGGVPDTPDGYFGPLLRVYAKTNGGAKGQ